MYDYKKKTLKELIDGILWFDLPNRLKEILKRIGSGGGDSLWKKSETFTDYIEPDNFKGINPAVGTNIVVGGDALKSNTSGNYNLAFGISSLESNTSGSYNVAVGDSSLSENKTGSQNTAVGDYTLVGNVSGDLNTAVGYYALCNNTSGGWNTAIGSSSLASNTSGAFNVALGGGSAYSLTSGRWNTSLGYLALQGRIANVTGDNNIAVGFQSLRGVTSGARNIEISAPTNDNITSGSGNININSLPAINIGTGSNNLILGGVTTSTANINGTDENIVIGVNGKIRYRVTSGGNHGINTATPNSSAVLHIESKDKGFLPPVLTTTQKEAIITPAKGLMVYDSTLDTISVFNGTIWKNVQLT